jgi:hypothetical protein
MKTMEAQLADPELYQDPARFHPLLRQFQEARAKVAELQGRLAAGGGRKG